MHVRDINYMQGFDGETYRKIAWKN